MRIVLETDPARGRRWHRVLAERLRADGHDVWIAPVATSSARPPSGVDLLLQFERLVYGAGAGSLYEPAATAGPPAPAEIGLAIVLAEGAGSTSVQHRCSVLFDGEGGEVGLLHALLDGRAPTLAVLDDKTQTVLASGLPALENPNRLGAGLDAVLTRAVGLSRTAVRSFDRAATSPRVKASGPPAMAGRSALGFGLASLAAKVSNRLSRLMRTDHQWQTGWRQIDPSGADGVRSRLTWPATEYHWLRDDGRRFYADPFVVTHAGRTVLFVEEYPYATQRGIISAVDITPGGLAGTPQPVLECGYHLSYPSVFERDGTVWMIPETSGNRTIELYRADPFPDRWVLDRVLVDDVSAGDATLLDHEGRLYLFATTNDDGVSTWDQLSIFHAPTLSSPWLPHDANPVLVDAGAARPAGFTFTRDGALIRPAQDCRGGYGAGLTFCRIDRLDEARFKQTPIGALPPPPSWRASGAHTLNEAGGIEVVDRIGPRLRG